MSENQEKEEVVLGSATITFHTIQKPTWDEKEKLKKSTLLVGVKDEENDLDYHVLIKAKIKEIKEDA